MYLIVTCFVYIISKHQDSISCSKSLYEIQNIRSCLHNILKREMDLFQDPNEFWLESDSSANEENPNEEANDINEIQFIKEVIHVESTAPPPGTSKEPKPYVCPFCEWSGTNNRGVFKAHIKNLHPEEEGQTENKSAPREEDGEPPAKKLEMEEVKAEVQTLPPTPVGTTVGTPVETPDITPDETPDGTPVGTPIGSPVGRSKTRVTPKQLEFEFGPVSPDRGGAIQDTSHENEQHYVG